MEWFEQLPGHAVVQCMARLDRLGKYGHHLRRPVADYLRDGIYELRARAGRVHLRILFFFSGRDSIVVSHGFAKREAAVPEVEIERALGRKRAFEANPRLHTFMERSWPSADQ